MHSYSNEIENIIKGCIKKKKKYQEEMFKLYYGKMMSLCVRYMGSYEEAKDVLQDGFIKLFDKLDKYNLDSSFDSWIKRLFVNTAIDAIRKKNRAPFMINNYETVIKDSNNIDFLDENLKLTSLKAEFALEAISKLSPAYKTVFNLYVIENYTHREISDILGISEGTSKSNLAKAKIKLRNILDKKINKLNEL